MFKRVPYWIKGGVLADMYVALIFALKMTCPSNATCFADPFLTSIYFPFTFIDTVLSETQTLALGEHIILAMFVTWFVVGAFLGFMYSALHSTPSFGA